MRDKLGLHPSGGESDVAGDDHLSESRATGGLDGDAASTTGTGPSEEFVGRISGQDDGADYRRVLPHPGLTREPERHGR